MTMSDRELRTRRKLASGIAYTTSTIGLGTLGGKVGGAALKRAGKLKKVTAVIDRHTPTALATSAGIGGAGGYNYAAITNEEARRENLKRSMQTPQKVERSKAYDPERKRKGRLKVYRNTATGVGVAGAVAGGGAIGITHAKYPLHRALNNAAKGKTGRTYQNLKQAAYHVDKLPGVGSKKASKFALGAAGVGLAGTVAANRIESYRRHSGKSYKPRYG